MKLKCGHQFHHSCIKELFCIYLSDKCPMCRDKFSYQPSKKRKSMRRLRNKILKLNTNSHGFMERKKCADLYYYFHSRKVKMSFLIKMARRLRERRDYNYIKYTKDIISLHKSPILATGEKIIYINRDMSDKDEAEQEQFRRELHPYVLGLYNGEQREFEITRLDREDNYNGEREFIYIAVGSEIDQLEEKIGRNEIAFSNTYNVTLAQIAYMFLLNPTFEFDAFIESLQPIPEDVQHDRYIGMEFIRILNEREVLHEERIENGTLERDRRNEINAFRYGRKFNLNVFHMQEIFRHYPNFQEHIDFLINCFYSERGEGIIHDILLHTNDGWDGQTVVEEYDDDVRICNMYNIQERVLNHLYEAHGGFNIHNLELDFEEAEEDDLVEYVRGLIFEEINDLQELNQDNPQFNGVVLDPINDSENMIPHILLNMCNSQRERLINLMNENSEVEITYNGLTAYLLP